MCGACSEQENETRAEAFWVKCNHDLYLTNICFFPVRAISRGLGRSERLANAFAMSVTMNIL
jgi:hypothetical protein